MDSQKSPIERLIVRQTEKALLITTTTTRGMRDVWFPRSQVEISGEIVWVADWLLTAKARELGVAIITVDRAIAATMAA